MVRDDVGIAPVVGHSPELDKKSLIMAQGSALVMVNGSRHQIVEDIQSSFRQVLFVRVNCWSAFPSLAFSISK